MDFQYQYEFSNADLMGAAGFVLGMFMWIMLAVLIIAVITVVAKWRVFRKMGQPGWYALIPFWSDYAMTVGASGERNLALGVAIVNGVYWAVSLAARDSSGTFLASLSGLFFIASLVLTFVMCHRVSRAFGHGNGYMVGLALLGFVFWPIIAFGASTYLGPVTNGSGSSDSGNFA